MGNMLRVATLHTTVVLALLVSFSLCTTLSREKPPHPDYRTGVPGYTAPSFDGYGLEGCDECSQVTLFCFVVVAVLRYRNTKPDEWLNFRARRRFPCARSVPVGPIAGLGNFARVQGGWLYHRLLPARVSISSRAE